MTQPTVEPASEEPLGQPPIWSGDPAVESAEPRNLLLLACHQIVLRIGWLFKTESVIIPAFLDQVAGAVGNTTGAGWIRGFLPLLNRMGQSVPPVFAADFLKSLRYKRWALAAFAGLMSLPFFVMSGAWLTVGDQSHSWLCWGFLGLYFMFFIAYGLYLLAFGTMQGKIIRPTRRGRLLLMSTFWGAIPATLIAIGLLPGWLESPPRWDCIFGFVGGCFLLSSLIALMLFEPADKPMSPIHQPEDLLDTPKTPRSDHHPLSVGEKPAKSGSLWDTIETLRRDTNLRCLVITAMLFASGLIIVPHYQAMARVRLQLEGVDWLVWVITQNAAVAIFGLFAGPMADRRGYRLTLRLLIFGSAIAPAFAVSLVFLSGGFGGALFWTVYIPLGMSPLVLQTLRNYALEICEPRHHPRYLSIVSLGLAVPFLLSPAVGLLIDTIGFEPIFLGAACLMVFSGALTFRLDEPRHRFRADSRETLGVGPEE